MEFWAYPFHNPDISFCSLVLIMANELTVHYNVLRGDKLSTTSIRPKKRMRPGRLAITTLLLIIVLSGVVGALWLTWCLHDLPSAKVPNTTAVRSSITVLAENGEVIAKVGDLPGEVLAPGQLPNAVIAAVLSTEDRRFYSHFGIDPIGIARALIHNLRAGGIEQGGSTITQQLAKILFLSPDRTLKRKVQEMALAFKLERHYSKQEILALYLNRAYFGSGAYGIDIAAHRYFDRPAQKLKISEAVMLAGALKAPSRYNLLADRTAAIGRARIVLSNMVDAGTITQANANTIANELPLLITKVTAPTGGYFADWVVEQVRGMPETWGRNVTVTTTLDIKLQKAAEARIQATLASMGDKNKIGQAAAVIMTPEGAVKAMIGGRSYANSPYNRAVQARRQPGSAFKTFVYLAAMEHGTSPADIVLDEPIKIGDWSPDNYKSIYRGPVTVSTAFANSLNAPAVRLAEKVGLRTISETALRLGIESPLRHDATIVLGSSEVGVMEITGAVATIASGGIRPDIHGIIEIRSNAETVLYHHYIDESPPVIEASAVTQMQDIMSEVIRSGTGKAAALDRPAAGKTGTSQNYRDAWFVGFTGNLVAGVWLGNDDNSPMNTVTGGNHAAWLWREVMVLAHDDLAQVALRAPNQRHLFTYKTTPSPETTDAETFLQQATGG